MSNEENRAKCQLFNKKNQLQFESTISACLEAIDGKLYKDDFGNLLMLSHLNFIIIENILKAAKQHENKNPIKTHKIYELYKDLEQDNQDIINQNMHLLEDKYKIYYGHVEQLLYKYNGIYNFLRFYIYNNPNQMHVYTRELLFLSEILIKSIGLKINTKVFEKIYNNKKQ